MHGDALKILGNLSASSWKYIKGDDDDEEKIDVCKFSFIDS